jgi:hypothetical protein
MRRFESRRPRLRVLANFDSGMWRPVSLQRVTYEVAQKPRDTARFRSYELVSLCGNWRRKRPFGSLSPRADFGVSFSGAYGVQSRGVAQCAGHQGRPTR